MAQSLMKDILSPESTFDGQRKVENIRPEAAGLDWGWQQDSDLEI